MSRDSANEYPFGLPNEENAYSVFPAVLENDLNVFFHGTGAANLDSILRDGFEPSPPLQTSTFTRRSGAALGHACQKFAAVDRCVLAVRVDDLNVEGIAQESFGIYIHAAKGPKPTVIGYCIVPATYAFA